MPEWLSPILTGASAAALIKLIESVIVWRLNRKAKLKDEAEAQARAEEEREKAQKDEEYKELVRTVRSLETAQRVSFHDRIKYLARGYIRDKEIDIHDRSDLVAMHDVYHNELNGNGDLDYLMDQVKKLPLK